MLLLPTPSTVTTATNLDGPHSALPVSPPLSGVPVARGPLMLNLDMDTVMVIMDTPPTADIMDTPILEQVSPDILPVPLTHTEVSKVLASKMQ